MRPTTARARCHFRRGSEAYDSPRTKPARPAVWRSGIGSNSMTILAFFIAFPIALLTRPSSSCH